MDKISIFLGNNENEIKVNQILTVTKHEIYKSKWNKTHISLLKIKKLLKSNVELDIYIGTVRNILPKILEKWSALYNMLRAI